MQQYAALRASRSMLLLVEAANWTSCAQQVRTGFGLAAHSSSEPDSPLPAHAHSPGSPCPRHGIPPAGCRPRRGVSRRRRGLQTRLRCVQCLAKGRSAASVVCAWDFDRWSLTDWQVRDRTAASCGKVAVPSAVVIGLPEVL